MEAKPLVLVVDDDLYTRKALSRILRAHAMDVETFATAQELLDRGAPEHVSCLILDIRMPGLSGLELQERLPEHGFDAPVIFLTGYATESMKAQAMDAGAVAFLEKPFVEQDLLTTVREALRKA